MNKAKKAPVTKPAQGGGLYSHFEIFFTKNDRKIFYALLGVCIFLSLISFNARISEAHDDALYLEGGWRYVNEFPTYFYTQNAPLYPMFLGLLIKLVGFRLILFKLVSVAFNALGFVLFYRALKNRIPAVVFLPVAMFHASNHLIMYFASMTFTEAFYFFLQNLFFFYAVKIIDLVDTGQFGIKTNWRLWLMMGLSMFLVSTAKSAAIVVIPAVLLYFLIYRNWKAMGYSLGSYLVFKVTYEAMVKTIWNAQNQFSSQGKILMQKDPYDASLGVEDSWGFVTRFFENCDLSFSKRFYQLLGFRPEHRLDGGEIETYPFLTFITATLMLMGFIFLFRARKKEMVMLALFTGAQVVLSFVILQTRWDQPRITLVCMPVLLILIFFGLYSILKKGIGPGIYSALALVIICSVDVSSIKRGFKNIPIVQKNLKGDTYYGYTPDWQNFLKCSEWCADSLASNTLVVSRKAPMSFVYGKGKKFFPVYSVIFKDTATNQSNPDSALAFFKRKHVTHVLLGSLRMNPTDPAYGVINTLHNILGPIAEKYPNKLKLVHTEGIMEESYVYEIVY